MNTNVIESREPHRTPKPDPMKPAWFASKRLRDRLIVTLGRVRRFPGTIECGLLVAVSLISCAIHGCRQPVELPATRQSTPIRAVWVTRFHYRSAAEIALIMRNIRELGANTVLWQVRGEGTVAYPSELEPWPVEYGHQHPGFDPLATAVREAHANGLKIHAWCNTLTGWKGKKPALPGQLFAAHPNWFVRDEDGRLPTTGDFYLPLNPALPEVRAHLVALFEEIVTRYDVDGIQLDYVRYVLDEQKDRRDRFPGDPATLDLYRRQTGLAPAENAAAWHHWRAAQITQLVREVREMLARRRPEAMLSASVWASPLNGYRDHMQNAVSWLNVGLLDTIFTMTYSGNAQEFEKYVHLYRDNCPGGRVIPGLGLYKHERGAQTAEQMQICDGVYKDVALYSYDSLFDGLTEKPNARVKAQRAERRAAIIPFFTK